MAIDLRKRLKEQLAPDGIWTMREEIKSLIQKLLKRLPRGSVSEQERRYPTTPQGMREFLDAFFARHYFQVQDSLVAHLTSSEFMQSIQSGHIQLADIGSGPAIASLAIIDMLEVILAHLSEKGNRPSRKPLMLSIVLNDTSEICLDFAKSVLQSFAQGAMRKHGVQIKTITSLSRPFPASLPNLRRVTKASGALDLVCFSYVLVPLTEQVSPATACSGIRQLLESCNLEAGILVIQDKFHEPLIRRMCRLLGVSVNRETIRQNIYDTQNQNSEQTYTFYRALFKPGECSVSKVATPLLTA